MSFAFEPIGTIHSCFKEKFGIPRQPGLVTEARAILELLPPYNREEAVRGLEGFSHLWVVFVFHASMQEEWKPTVRPPRLGGNRRLGVFATRSPVRPNPIGLSVVTLEKIVCEAGRVELHLKGIDLLDGTPVLDIKPYVPYVDSIPDASGGFADEAPAAAFEISFTPEARHVCQAQPGLEALIRQVLSQDPRPAYYGKGGGRQSFGMKLMDCDVKWEIDDGALRVTGIVKV